MKNSIAVTLIVCGTILLALPPVYNLVAMHLVTKTMISLEKPVNVTGNMSEHADTVCMVAGVLMILIATLAGLFRRES